MPSSVSGLPLHPLVVHATVVLVPLAALLVLLAALWPAARRWAGPLPLGVSLVALILDPISTSSGENLAHALPHDELIEQHAHLADGLLPWVVALTAAGAAQAWLWWRGRGTDRPGAPTALVVAAAVLAVIAAGGTTVQVVRIGHSGAKAAWAGTAAAGR